MSIVERIKDLATSKETNIAEIERQAGLNRGTIGKWSSSMPSADKLLKVANLLNVSIEYLLTGEKTFKNDLSLNEQELIEYFRMLQPKEKYKVLGRIETYLEEYHYLSESDPKEIDEDFITKEEPETNITYLDKYRELTFETELWGEVSAGSGIDAIPSRETIKVPFKCDFALRITGNSMEPLYYDQQIIYLKQQPDVEQGQIAAVQIDDYIPIAYLKKVYKEGSNIRLVSINPLYEDKIYQASQVKILGIVIDNNDIFF